MHNCIWTYMYAFYLAHALGFKLFRVINFLQNINKNVEYKGIHKLRIDVNIEMRLFQCN